MTADPEGVPDTVMAEEKFKPTDPRAHTQQLALGADGLLRIGQSGRCLSAAPPSSSSVFGRKLPGGAWAVLLINWAKAAQTVTCDEACMGKMGWGGGARVAVRDLWAHTSNGTATALSFVVPGGGASVLVKVTPTTMV